MTPYAVLLWLHVLMFVFWLGADVGVFTCGVMMRRPGLTPAQRLLLLEAASVVDLFPRACAVFMLPIGFTLAERFGSPVTGAWLAAVWLAALVWGGLVVASLRIHDPVLAPRIRHVSNLYLLLLGAAAVGFGVWWLTHGALAWLGLKVVLYGAVYWAAIGIDYAFFPAVVGLLGAQEADAAQPLAEGTARSIGNTLIVVGVLYALLLAASFLGTVKPIS